MSGAVHLVGFEVLLRVGDDDMRVCGLGAVAGGGGRSVSTAGRGRRRGRAGRCEQSGAHPGSLLRHFLSVVYAGLIFALNSRVKTACAKERDKNTKKSQAIWRPRDGGTQPLESLNDAEYLSRQVQRACSKSSTLSLHLCGRGILAAAAASSPVVVGCWSDMRARR